MEVSGSLTTGPFLVAELAVTNPSIGGNGAWTYTHFAYLSNLADFRGAPSGPEDIPPLKAAPRWLIPCGPSEARRHPRPTQAIGA